MAITFQEQTLLIKLVIGMFGIAPGYTYLPVVAKGYEDLGRNLPESASTLAGLPQFRALDPAGMAATAFAAKFLGTLGLQNDATANRLAVELFNQGVAPEQIILQAILALHTSAGELGRPVFTALSIGFGAGVLYFPAGSRASLAQIIEHDMALAAGEGDASYAAVFGRIMGRIGAHLDRQVVEQVTRALTVMEDGRPCPASQISVGSFTVAAMAVSMMHDMLSGREVTAAPMMVVHSFRNQQTKTIDISQ